MSDRRMSQSADRRDDLTVEVESLRAADAAGRATDEPPAKAKRSDEESLSLFWRVFGGTILSITALVAITLYNNLSTGISELRADVARMNEAKGEFARKDDVNAVRLLAATHAGYRAEIDTLKERASKYRTELEDAKKELSAKVETLSKAESVVNDGLRRELAGVESMKEKLLSLTVDLKAAREELAKVHGEVEKNQTADTERSARRDAQMKQLDDAMKELTKTLGVTREKLARLEGQQTPPKPAEVGPPKPPTKPKTVVPPDDDE